MRDESPEFFSLIDGPFSCNQSLPSNGNHCCVSPPLASSCPASQHCFCWQEHASVVCSPCLQLQGLLAVPCWPYQGQKLPDTGSNCEQMTVTSRNGPEVPIFVFTCIGVKPMQVRKSCAPYHAFHGAAFTFYFFKFEKFSAQSQYISKRSFIYSSTMLKIAGPWAAQSTFCCLHFSCRPVNWNSEVLFD